MIINFILVAEGTSDNALIPHLEQLCIKCGASEVSGAAIDFSRLPVRVGNGISDKLSEARRLAPEANLFFIHRDADAVDASPRLQEVEDVVTTSALDCAWIAVVPVQEIEAWLLLDEDAIRRVVSKPRGTIPLDLPNARNVEEVVNPKEYLQQILLQASEATGRRLQKCRRNFGIHRKMLLERLSADGPLYAIPSWRRMHDELCKVIAALNCSRG